jgi:hypothetical protein
VNVLNVEMERAQGTSVLRSLGHALATSRPWLSPFNDLATRLAQSDADSVSAGLNRLNDAGIATRFVAQSHLPAKEPYETFIARTSSVPTRDNLHDLFNGLVWLTFPKTKQRMNGLQAQEIAGRGISGSRGALRDTLTVFDENGAILHAPAELNDALRKRDWQTLFITQRSMWQSARLVLFGHALLEKLVEPRKSITAHVLLAADITDDALAATLDPETLASKPLLPLPVLGVPGWWGENEASEFYDDDTVFRTAR